MDDRRLMYFKDPLVRTKLHPETIPFALSNLLICKTNALSVIQDAYARGEVFIGSKENSYTVFSGLPPSTQGYHWNHGITIVTPDRKFLFACETEAEQRDWIAAFQRVINRPMRPQEYAGMKISEKLLTELIWLYHSFSCFSEFFVEDHNHQNY